MSNMHCESMKRLGRCEAEKLRHKLERANNALEDAADTPTIAYMCGASDSKDRMRGAVEWFLECWEMEPPDRAEPYGEAEDSLMKAVDDLAKVAGVAREVRHKSTDMNEQANDSM